MSTTQSIYTAPFFSSTSASFTSHLSNKTETTDKDFSFTSPDFNIETTNQKINNNFTQPHVNSTTEINYENYTNNHNQTSTGLHNFNSTQLLG